MSGLDLIILLHSSTRHSSILGLLLEMLKRSFQGLLSPSLQMKVSRVRPGLTLRGVLLTDFGLCYDFPLPLYLTRLEVQEGFEGIGLAWDQTGILQGLAPLWLAPSLELLSSSMELTLQTSQQLMAELDILSSITSVISIMSRILRAWGSSRASVVKSSELIPWLMKSKITLMGWIRRSLPHLTVVFRCISSQWSFVNKVRTIQLLFILASNLISLGFTLNAA